MREIVWWLGRVCEHGCIFLLEFYSHPLLYLSTNNIYRCIFGVTPMLRLSEGLWCCLYTSMFNSYIWMYNVTFANLHCNHPLFITWELHGFEAKVRHQQFPPLDSLCLDWWFPCCFQAVFLVSEKASAFESGEGENVMLIYLWLQGKNVEDCKSLFMTS